jgi:hypothetical protein
MCKPDGQRLRGARKMDAQVPAKLEYEIEVSG